MLTHLFARLVLSITILALAGSLYVPAWAESPPAKPPVDIALEYVRAPDGAKVLLVRLSPDAAYYTYAYNAGTGRPTRLSLLEGGTALSLATRYPEGSPHKDVFSGKNVSAYTGTVPVFISLPPKLDAKELDAKEGTIANSQLSLLVSMLLCSSAHCIPVDMRLPLPPLPEKLSELADTPWLAAWQSSAVLIPDVQTLVPAESPRAENTEQPGLSPLPVKAFAISSGLAGEADKASSLPVVPLKNTAPTRYEWTFIPQSEAASEPTALGSALFWGLLAGFVLNFMPCVLPVITLKLSTLLGAASDNSAWNDPVRLRRFREHNLFFAAGVLSWFAVLAGAISGLGMTWGGLFQHAWAVAGLAALIGVLGLSMLDLCTLPVIDLKAGMSGSPRGQAYMTGVTATLLATPCSGPLLGGVLAWSASQPPLVVLLVFLSTGLGMALPYLIFALWPRTVRLLPRPGAWLGWLEHGVGILLLATCVYLLSLLPWTIGMSLATGIGLLAGLFIMRRAKLWRLAARAVVGQGAVALACLGLTLWILAPSVENKATADQSTMLWEAFSPATFEELRGKEPILLEFTADWCPNCKVLEATTLSPERLQTWKTTYKLRLMRVDMSMYNPEHEKLLRALHSISIPLTAIFPVGADADKPVLLRDVYTPNQLEQALKKVFATTK